MSYWGAQRSTGPQPYIASVEEDVTLPITVAELAAWLKILDAATITAQTDVLQMIIDSVIKSAEDYTKRDLYLKTYTTKRDTFGDNGETPAYFNYPAQYLQNSTNNCLPICLRKSPLSEVNAITYLDVDGAQQTLDAALYYTVYKDDFSLVFPVTYWPATKNIQQCITIEFDAGYSADNTFGITLPPSLKTALLMHAASVYENRGDCGGDCSCSSAPGPAKSCYNQNRIVSFAV